MDQAQVFLSQDAARLLLSTKTRVGAQLELLSSLSPSLSLSLVRALFEDVEDHALADGGEEVEGPVSLEGAAGSHVGEVRHLNLLLRSRLLALLLAPPAEEATA